MRYYDNSMLETFRRCHRQYFFRHVKNWVPASTSHDLIFGLCWHSAMDKVWEKSDDSSVNDKDLLVYAYEGFMSKWNEYYPPQQTDTLSMEEDLFPKTPSRAFEMLHWYIKERREIISKYEILGIELPFVVPLGDSIESEYQIDSLKDVAYIGRNDKVVKKEDGYIYIVDHKTTNTDKSIWFDSFMPNNQIDGYNYAGILTYGGDNFFGTQIDGALCQKGSRGSSAENGRPAGIGFPQHILSAATGHTEAWLWETTYTVLLLESHLDMLNECSPGDSILKAFDKMTTACGYYRGCVYRNICAYVPNPLSIIEVPIGFKEEKWEPFNLNEIENEKGEK